LSSFKKQLEDAGHFVQQAQEAQKAAEKEAAKFGEDARVAAESKRQAEEYAHNVTEVKRQADEQAAKEREAVRREMDDRIAKVVEDAEVRRKALEERTKIAEEALRVGANIGKNGKGKGKEVMANISDDEDDLMVEAQLRDREEETGTSVLEAEKCLTNDVDMDNADTHNGGNEVEEPETSMPGALDHIVQPNASNSEGRQESGPRKSSPKTSGTLAVAKNMVTATDCVVYFVALI
jgi:membrane protein involved in colicin uptake